MAPLARRPLPCLGSRKRSPRRTGRKHRALLQERHPRRNRAMSSQKTPGDRATPLKLCEAMVERGPADRRRAAGSHLPRGAHTLGARARKMRLRPRRGKARTLRLPQPSPAEEERRVQLRAVLLLCAIPLRSTIAYHFQDICNADSFSLRICKYKTMTACCILPPSVAKTVGVLVFGISPHAEEVQSLYPNLSADGGIRFSEPGPNSSEATYMKILLSAIPIAALLAISVPDLSPAHSTIPRSSLFPIRSGDRSLPLTSFLLTHGACLAHPAALGGSLIMAPSSVTL